MRCAYPLILSLILTSPLPADTRHGLAVLDVESDSCSIFHALTGQAMVGCPTAIQHDRIARSLTAEDGKGYVVQFDFDSKELKAAAQDHLKRLSGLLTGTLSNLCVKLVGHADTSGSASYNQALSDRRAKSVRLFLIGPGSVSANRLIANGYGEKYPIAGIPGPDERNRRVEILAKEAPNGQCA